MTASDISEFDVDPLQGLRIIDCDAHLTEPADLWTARAPRSMKDRVPVHRTENEYTSWYLNGESWSTLGGNTIRQGNEKVLGVLSLQPYEEVDPSSWSVRERLALMDLMGVHAQIIYPNGIGFASNHIFAIEDEQDRLAILQIYNDFLVEVQEESNNRLFPQAMLPVWDMDLTVSEMNRMLDKGITGFTLSDKPEMLGLPELPEPYFDPMWDLFNESGAIPNFHIGSGQTRAQVEARRAVHRGQDGADRRENKVRTSVDLAWRSFGPQRYAAVGAAQHFMSNVRIVANLCMSNVFDRYPKLKIVSAESGIGWVPFVLESLEFQFDEMVTGDELTFAKRRPTEYFRDHMYVMFWFERLAAQNLKESLGVSNVLVETDVPHPVCLYPGAREHFAEVMAGFTPDERRRVLQDNAAKLYGIELPS